MCLSFSSSRSIVSRHFDGFGYCLVCLCPPSPHPTRCSPPTFFRCHRPLLLLYFQRGLVKQQMKSSENNFFQLLILCACTCHLHSAEEIGSFHAFESDSPQTFHDSPPMCLIPPFQGPFLNAFSNINQTLSIKERLGIGLELGLA